MRKRPEVTIGNETFTAPEPKAQLWREFAALENERHGMAEEDFLESRVKIIALAFQSKKITTEILLENLNISDVLPLYLEAQAWLYGKVAEKLEKIPNAETPAE